ncbi:MAG: UbiA family prenyltransferase [Anaerolineaceae bacterium]|nr:UbiA family prenyltransferase [Anaerolineaceae bacterium]
MIKIRAFFDLIKFEHTIFALPFAYLGMLLAKRGWPGFAEFFWITMAMVAARTLAMGFNRIADRYWDAHNPRTDQRPLVTGTVTLTTAWVGTVLALLLLFFSAWKLGALTLLLAPGAVVFLIGYSFTKRFTVLSHFILGFTDGLAPAGAWVALRGSLFTPADLPAWLLVGIVTLWIGGFDLIYACQDIDFDRKFNLHSIPARFGVGFALQLSTACHLAMLGLLAWLGSTMALPWPFWMAFIIVAGLLVWEHRLVHPEDLSNINLAFFNINSYISLTLFAGVLAALYV